MEPGEAGSKGVVDAEAGPVGRLRPALTGVLVALVVIGALLPGLALVSAWRLSGDPAMSPYPSGEAPRALVVVEILSFTTSGLDAPVVVGIVAALALIVLEVRPSRSSGSARRPPWALAVVVPAGAVASLVALVHAGALLSVMALTPEELTAASFGERLELYDGQRLLGLVAQVLAWFAILLFGVGRWRAGSEDEEVTGTVGGRVDTAAGAVDLGGPPAEAPRSGPPSGTGPPDRVEPARLRPDGSSDSGFDEFHFRR